MAQLKSTNINGNLAVTGNVVAPSVDITDLKVESIQHPEETGIIQLGKVSLGGNASSSGGSLLQKDVATGTIGEGPAFGTSTTQFLRNDGTWAEPAGTGSGNVVGADQIKGIYVAAGNRSIRAVDANTGITFQEKGTLFKDAAGSSTITDTLFVQRVPIAAGNNITFETDAENQVVKINGTAASPITKVEYDASAAELTLYL